MSQNENKNKNRRTKETKNEQNKSAAPHLTDQETMNVGTHEPWYEKFKNMSIYSASNIEEVVEKVFSNIKTEDIKSVSGSSVEAAFHALTNEEQIVSFDKAKIGLKPEKLSATLKTYHSMISGNDPDATAEDLSGLFLNNKNLLDYCKSQSPRLDYKKDFVLRSFYQNRDNVANNNKSAFMNFKTKFIRTNDSDIKLYNEAFLNINQNFATYHKVKYRFKFIKNWERFEVKLSGAGNLALTSVLEDIKLLFQHAHVQGSFSDFKTHLIDLAAILSHKKLTQDVIQKLMGNQPRFGLTRNKDLVYTDKQVERALDEILDSGAVKREISQLLSTNELIRNIYLKLLCFELSTFFTIKYLNKVKAVKTFKSGDIKDPHQLLNLIRFERFTNALGKFFEVLEATATSEDFTSDKRLSESLMYDTISDNRRVLISVLSYMNNFESYLLTLQTLICTKELQIKNKVLTEKPELLAMREVEHASEIVQILIPALYSSEVRRNAFSFDITSEDARIHCETLMSALERCDLIYKQDITDYHTKYAYNLLLDERNQREGMIITRGMEGQTNNQLFKHFNLYLTNGKSPNNVMHQFNSESFKPATAVLNSLLGGFNALVSSDLISQSLRQLTKTDLGVDCFIYPSNLDDEIVTGYPITKADLIAISLNQGEFTLRHKYDLSQISSEEIYSSILSDEDKVFAASNANNHSYLEFRIHTDDLRVSEVHKDFRDFKPLDNIYVTRDPLFYMFMHHLSASNHTIECTNKKIFDKQIINNLDLMEDYLLDDEQMLGNSIGLTYVSEFEIGDYNIKVPMSFRDYNLSLFTEHARMFRLPINHCISHANLAITSDLFKYQEEVGELSGISKDVIAKQNAYYYLNLVKAFIKASPVHQKLIRDYSAFIFKVLSYKEKLSISSFRGTFIRRVYNEVGIRLFALYAVLLEAIDIDQLNDMLVTINNHLQDELLFEDIFEIRDNL